MGWTHISTCPSTSRLYIGANHDSQHVHADTKAVSKKHCGTQRSVFCFTGMIYACYVKPTVSTSFFLQVLQSLAHRPLFSIELYLGLLSPSSSNCIWSLLNSFLSLDFSYMYSLVDLFLYVHKVFTSAPTCQRVHLLVSMLVRASSISSSYLYYHRFLSSFSPKIFIS